MLAKLIKLLPPGERLAVFEELSPLMLGYIKGFIARPDLEQLSYFLRKYLSVLKGLTKERPKFFEPVPGPIPAATTELAKLMVQAFELSNKRKQKLHKEFKSSDLTDSDVREDFEEKMDEVTVVDQAVMEVSGELMKLGDANGVFRELLTKVLLPHYSEILGRKNFNSTNEALYALCFFTDLFEFGPDDLFFQNVSQVVVGAVGQIEFNQEVPDVLQTISCLMGAIAYRLPETGQEDLAQNLMSTLYKFLQAPLLSTEDTKECRDNVVAALVRLFLKHAKSLLKTDSQASQIMSVLSQNLPLTTDKEESRTVNRILVSELAAQNWLLTGAADRLQTSQEILARAVAADVGKTDSQEMLLDAHTAQALK
jgi:hypothetical protein